MFFVKDKMARNKPSLEIALDRYSHLNGQLRSNLTDYYNHFIGLASIAWGDDSQRDNALRILSSRVAEGREAFCKDPLTAYTREQLEAGNLSFTSSDFEHLREITSVVAKLNATVKKGKLNQEYAKKAYELLIPYLYGRKFKK